MSGIELEVIWFDEDVVELRVRVGNGRFAGEADAYVSVGGLALAAETLRGFPATIVDRRDVEFGTFDPGYAGGGAGLSFRCVDRAAHAVVDVRLQAKESACGVQDWIEMAEFTVPVEAAGIDRFVAQLGRLEGAVGNTAHLQLAI